jgi:hypothetical protein
VPKSSFRTVAVSLVLAAVAIVVLLWRSQSNDVPPMPEVGVAAPAPPAAPASQPTAVAVDAAPAATAVVPPKPVVPHPRAMPNELQLMARLRGLKDKDPTAAIELAREGNRRFPDTADAAERASIVVHALSALGRPSEARGEAEEMVNHYPDDHWVREVEGFMGAHRRRSVRVNDAGELIAE